MEMRMTFKSCNPQLVSVFSSWPYWWRAYNPLIPPFCFIVCLAPFAFVIHLARNPTGII